MKRLLCLSSICLAASFAGAEELHLGIYMPVGNSLNRVGTSVYSERKDTVNGRELARSDSNTTMAVGMMGGDLNVQINTTTWTDEKSGRPVRILYITKSAGRTQTVDAKFGEKYATVAMSSGGPTQTKQLLIPTDAPIVDDPMPLVLKEHSNAPHACYELRPDTVSFAKDTVSNKGQTKVTVGGKSYDAILIQVVDPQTTMHVYVSDKGDLLEMDGPLGLQMIPDELMAGQPAETGAGTAKTDLATASSITPDKAVDDPANLGRFKFTLTAPGAQSIPSDEHQTAVKKGDVWQMDIHPVDITQTAGVTLQEAAKQQPKWIQPDTYIPSNSQRFRDLAKRIIGDDNRVRDAAIDVQQWIAKRMEPDPGIGVLRDANEVLTSRQGVCRDYAILAATILRAGGVPTRLCSGLVSWDGTFYYHAWVEVWNGKNWIGVDPTVTDAQISAAHIKLADGDIATAFQFPVLDKVSIHVQEAVAR